VRVLVLSADYMPSAWSGIGSAVAVQAAAVARQGVDVEVMLPETCAAAAVSQGPRLRVRSLNGVRFPTRPEAFDVMHLHSLALSELALQLRSRFGIPLVYTSHASVRTELGGYSCASGWSAVQDLVIARSDHVLFPSASEREAAVQRSVGLRRRSSVHPNGIVRDHPPSTPSARTGPVVFAGRFTETKGLMLLSEIVRMLDCRPAIRFVLAGGHGDPAGERTVADLVARYPDRCQALGWLGPAALKRLLAAASMVLIPSRYEPFGQVALEAMQAGAPVLAAAVGGLPEVLGPGSSGLVVDSRRPEDWCAAIVGLWESPGARSALAQRGPSYVAARYDPDTLAGLLIDDVYLPVSTGRGAQS
jgi:glycosyltransferase involved in cell wall biosynthesis